MKHRNHTTIHGETFEVPKYIQRLDGDRVQGWQLRFGEWKLFSDFSNDGSGAREALRQAKAELADRLAKLPPKTGMKVDVASRKLSDLPLGISRAERRRKGRQTLQFYYQVTYPVFGGKPANKQVYIATENTLTREKQQVALAKSLAMRAEGERQFREAKRADQVGDSKQMKRALRDA